MIERVAARFAALVEPAVARVLGLPRIAMARAVYRRYEIASGPVLARGLAFMALFALVPAVLVILSLVGVLGADPGVKAEIVSILTAQLPPLAPVLDEALAAFAGLAPTTGIVSVLLLVWSASSVIRALDGAFRVIFEDGGETRTPVRYLVSVVAVAAGVFAAAMILVLVTFPGLAGELVGAFVAVPGPLVRAAGSLAVVTCLVAVSYRFVPLPRPAWSILWPPAVATSLVIFALSQLFGIFGPLLLGMAQLYGAFGALFLGLFWLGTTTQVLLLGASWVAERDRRARQAELRRYEDERAPGT
ncbi:MAG TPA: YihY/virulence factor BrkB family protein [Patescibacteria group bacterium]|nr:YihY/virulence factor BrkB family protein [Patescibacteria group bacterium]